MAQTHHIPHQRWHPAYPVRPFKESPALQDLDTRTDGTCGALAVFIAAYCKQHQIIEPWLAYDNFLVCYEMLRPEDQEGWVRTINAVATVATYRKWVYLMEEFIARRTFCIYRVTGKLPRMIGMDVINK